VIRIAISSAAFEAIQQGERYVWLENAMADRLAALRGPDESYSDVILRLAATGQMRS